MKLSRCFLPIVITLIVAAPAFSANLEPELAKLSPTGTQNDKVLSMVSENIEDMVLRKDFTGANKLYEAKLNACKQVFGGQSAPVLDALQDGIFIASQEQSNERARHLLGEFASVVSAMKAKNQGDAVELADKNRKSRLQAKLDADLARLFQPLAK